MWQKQRVNGASQQCKFTYRSIHQIIGETSLAREQDGRNKEEPLESQCKLGKLKNGRIIARNSAASGWESWREFKSSRHWNLPRATSCCSWEWGGLCYWKWEWQLINTQCEQQWDPVIDPTSHRMLPSHPTHRRQNRDNFKLFKLKATKLVGPGSSARYKSWQIHHSHTRITTISLHPSWIQNDQIVQWTNSCWTQTESRVNEEISILCAIFVLFFFSIFYYLSKHFRVVFESFLSSLSERLFILRVQQRVNAQISSVIAVKSNRQPWTAEHSRENSSIANATSIWETIWGSRKRIRMPTHCSFTPVLPLLTAIDVQLWTQAIPTVHHRLAVSKTKSIYRQDEKYLRNILSSWINDFCENLIEISTYHTWSEEGRRKAWRSINKSCVRRKIVQHLAWDWMIYTISQLLFEREKFGGEKREQTREKRLAYWGKTGEEWNLKHDVILSVRTSDENEISLPAFFAQQKQFIIVFVQNFGFFTPKFLHVFHEFCVSSCRTRARVLLKDSCRIQIFPWDLSEKIIGWKFQIFSLSANV